MSEEFRYRISLFLKEWIDVTDPKVGYGDDRVIRQGIKLLIETGVFDEQEMRKVALKEHGLVIPEGFINRCLNRTLAN